MSTDALARVVSAGEDRRRAVTDRCGLCARATADSHRHALDTEADTLLCLCADCVALFRIGSVGASRFRLVPTRRVPLDGFDPVALGLPVSLASVVINDDGFVRAMNPSVAGVTVWDIDRADWEHAVDEHPVLATVAPEVESVLVNDVRGASEHWIVPIDDTYRLVSIVRATWRGFSGGDEVWSAIDDFFDGLRRNSEPHQSR